MYCGLGAQVVRCRQERAQSTMGLWLLQRYLKGITEIYFSEPQTHNDRLMLRRLVTHLDSLGEVTNRITFGGDIAEHKEKAMFHSNRFCATDFAVQSWKDGGEKREVIEPKHIPANRDVTQSPPVRIAYEPLVRRETKVFREELESISAFQLGQRIVSKRYQFNGVHENYHNSKMIVTETPEERKEIPVDLDNFEWIEDPADPSTWFKKPEKFVGKTDLEKLTNKFNQRRSR